MTLFYPRFVSNEFAPMFRLADDFTRALASPSFHYPAARKIRSFQPRFDVKETRDSYELKGELPGLAQEDLEVFFQDANTLQIRGRTERHHEQGTRPSQHQTIEAQPEQPASVTEGQGEQAVEDTTSETSSYHKATVENEDGFEEVSATPAETTPAETPQPAVQTQEVAQPEQAEEGRYWLSERSVGQFARTFKFPNRIDHEAVKASLKNGILSIVVPKAAAPERRRIQIE